MKLYNFLLFQGIHRLVITLHVMVMEVQAQATIISITQLLRYLACFLGIVDAFGYSTRVPSGSGYPVGTQVVGYPTRVPSGYPSRVPNSGTQIGYANSDFED